MSNEVFPTLAGVAWDQKKVPIFKTISHRAVSGVESRLSLYQYPLYRYTLSYNVLRDTAAKADLKTLMGFYMSRYGAWDDFLYLDPSDSLITGATLTLITELTYQLGRTYGGFYEPCMDIIPAGSPLPVLKIYANGVLLEAGYSVNTATGVVTFTSAPAAPVTADFSFYHRVRFIEYGEGDEGFNNFMYQLWNLQKISLITAR